jgi:hypothetical protein
MTEQELRDLVKDCGLDWQRGYMPLFDGDPTNRYAVLIEAARAPLLAELAEVLTRAGNAARKAHAIEAELEALRAELDAAVAALAVESNSRNMFVARVENLYQNGNRWLSVTAVLNLLNDCDMLAASPKE